MFQLNAGQQRKGGSSKGAYLYKANDILRLGFKAKWHLPEAKRGIYIIPAHAEIQEYPTVRRTLG
ncbi:MAG: hypothetical protein P8171_04910 [Candidatus Thiodiazotropha sp.]|jgi:hypothetical protein